MMKKKDGAKETMLQIFKAGLESLGIDYDETIFVYEKNEDFGTGTVITWINGMGLMSCSYFDKNGHQYERM